MVWKLIQSHLTVIIFFIASSVLGNENVSSKENKFCRFHLAALNVENAHPAYMTIPDRVAEYSPIETLQYIHGRNFAGTPYRRLPNWTDAKVKIKMGQIKTLVDLMPEKPTILGLVEVRDASITSKIARTLDFEESIVTASINERGMDVALLVNPSEDLQIISTQEIALTGAEFASHPTRNLLVTTMLVAKRFLLHLVVVHWPSQGGPSESRVEAARQTRGLVSKLLSDHPGSEAIVMGDFNTLENEKDIRGRHPFRDVLLEPNGVASLADAFLLESLRAEDPPPEGTYYYAPNDEWNRLDRFFVTDGLTRHRATGLKLVAKSFRVHADPKVTSETHRRDGSIIRVPTRYNSEAEKQEDAGYTDHFGISIGIEARWQMSEPHGAKFIVDEDVFILSSVVLFPKGANGTRRFISWKEYALEKDRIGVEGSKFASYKIVPDQSFFRLTDSEDGKNWFFNDFKYEQEKKSGPQALGPRWAEFVQALQTKESAEHVRLELPPHRTHRPESIYQLLIALREQGLIKELPRLSNIYPDTHPQLVRRFLKSREPR